MTSFKDKKAFVGHFPEFNKREPCGQSECGCYVLVLLIFLFQE